MMNRGKHVVLIGVVSILLVSAGCLGGVANETPKDNTTTESENTNPNVTEQRTSVGSAATVTRVIDGDTIEVRYRSGGEDTIRLLGVDTPETTYSRVSPTEYNGIPDSTDGRDHLLNWGENAKNHAKSTLNGKQVRIVTDEESDERGYYGRLLGYVIVDGENFNRQLLVNGYARVYDSTFTKKQEFKQAELSA